MENEPVQKITMDFRHLLAIYQSAFIVRETVLNNGMCSDHYIAEGCRQVFDIFGQGVFDRRIESGATADVSKYGRAYYNFAYNSALRTLALQGSKEAETELNTRDKDVGTGETLDLIAELMSGTRAIINDYYQDEDLVAIWERINAFPPEIENIPLVLLLANLLLETLGIHLYQTETAKLIVADAHGLIGVPFSDERISIYDPEYMTKSAPTH